jgi:putative transposase
MPNTYTQIHVHLIFAVKNRNALIHTNWKERFHQYITGIIQNNNHKVLQINSMPDHIHILIGLRPHQSLSLLVQNVKSESSKWIQKEKLSIYKFEWQEGFGAFSYSKSQLNNIIHYIMNQEEHHREKSFLEEYVEFLEEFKIDFEEKFIFKDPI